MVRPPKAPRIPESLSAQLLAVLHIQQPGTSAKVEMYVVTDAKAVVCMRLIGCDTGTWSVLDDCDGMLVGGDSDDAKRRLHSVIHVPHSDPPLVERRRFQRPLWLTLGRGE